MRLVLISLDAVARPDADRLLSLPVFSALRREGVFCQNFLTAYPTLTYPIHTSIITGCYPEKHGIAHNQPFQPDTRPEMRAWYWEAGDIRAKTLWRAAREKGLTCASILWPVSGRNGDLGHNFPEILPLPGENATLKMLRYATPVWVLWMELLYGKTRKSIKQPDLDDYAVLLAEKLLLSRRPPDVLTLHLVDCDAMRHQYGADSEEAFDAMRRLDARVDRVLRAARRAGRMEDTVFCVVSDHGQINVQKEIDLNAELQRAGVGRAQTCGMGAYIFADDLARAQAFLEQNRERLLISDIYDEAALRALHAAPGVRLAVSAQRGCAFSDGEGAHKGDHGFSLSEPEARALLFLCGGPFKRGVELDRADVVDIAPTLARALGLSLPDADGKCLNEAF